MEGRKGESWKVFLFLLNEILFAGGTQLGNIRACERSRTLVEKQEHASETWSSYTLSHVVFPARFSTLAFLEFFFFWSGCPGGGGDWGF